MKFISTFFNCMFTAFSTYSRIPVPRGEWSDANMRWQICFFPVVGLAIGVLWALAAALLLKTGANAFFIGALLTVWPIILTGGINMDGFLDTSDAIHSWKPMEEKLKILKDPNIGAFAFIYGCLYLITSLGFMTQYTDVLKAALDPKLPIFCVAGGFMLSRTFSTIAILQFPKARKDGMVRTASDASAKHVISIVYVELAIELIVFAAAALLAHRPEPVLILLAAVGIFYYYYKTAMTKFGGTTGDLAGWFVELLELAILAIVTICGMLL